jgi:hypothetical protein
MTRFDLAALCIIGAIIVAATGNPGCGWLLFVAVLCL